MDKSLKDKVRSKINILQAQKRITGTWDLIKEQNFLLNTDLLVIDKDEFINLVKEVADEMVAARLDRNTSRES